jgi:hypothetical protein
VKTIQKKIQLHRTILKKTPPLKKTQQERTQQERTPQKKTPQKKILLEKTPQLKMKKTLEILPLMKNR